MPPVLLSSGIGPRASPAPRRLRPDRLSAAPDGLSAFPLIDVRTAAAFRAAHLVGSSSFPLGELRTRTLELPPPYGDTRNLSVLGRDATDVAEARAVLKPRGWLVACEHAYAAPDDASLASLGPVAHGGDSRRLWRPTPFLAELLEDDTMRRALGVETPAADAPSRRRLALDIGCGSGRDAVYMAEALGPSWTVLGLDNHVAALDRARGLAARELPPTAPGVRPPCRFAARELRKRGLPAADVDFALGVRWLHRPLLSQLKTRVKPGGAVVWVTFLDGVQSVAYPRRPSRYLARGELASLFAGWDIVRDVEGRLCNAEQQEAPAAFFAARKPLEA